MKIINLEARASLGPVDFDTKNLPKRVGLLSTVQLVHELPRIAAYLKKHNIEAKIGGQVLGCDQVAAFRVEKDVDGFLFIGSGRFHPIGVGAKTKKDIFVWHPGKKKLDKLDAETLVEIQKRQKGMLTKFLSSERIGVLVSTKAGQSTVQASLKTIMDLEKRYPEKRFYYFFTETFNFGEMENFPFVECWINTMCPRIREDVSVLNIEDLMQLEKSKAQQIK